jgi:NAD(P)-dependent dehydrogenase (short-subunit alcohol dehydrogenase family)
MIIGDFVPYTQMEDERVILITGATDGLGRAVARELAGRGATVLLHGRDRARTEQVRHEIREATGNDLLRTYLGDFSSLADVRELAAELSGNEPRLDVLINNAGIGTNLPGGGERMQSRDGYELRFQVNYLSGFLLTRLLEPLLIGSAPSRVVMVSSAGQMPIDFDDVQLERGYDGVRAYCQSKLAQVMFGFEEAKRLRDAGVAIASLHPATYMPTKMVFAARGSAVSTIEDGVAATLALVDRPPGEITGRYFNGLAEARADSQAYDEAARMRLWELSERLTAGEAA